MSDEGARSPVTLTRQQLYDQVWTTPMSRLGARYGISGNGLAKVCRRLDVPYPPRGYWARKAAGKKVSQARLPPPRTRTPLQATISPSLPAPPPPTLPQELADGLAAARALTADLAVPKRLPRPHPIVAAWIDERERLRTRRYPGSDYGYVPPDFSPIERRRHRILSVLFTALERHGGYTAKVDARGGMLVEVDGEPAHFSINEKYRQVRRPLTDEEKQRGFNPKRPWRQETHASGLLQLSIETPLHPALVRSWIDTPEQSLEWQLPGIAAVFIAAAPILRERRRRNEEAERRRHEEEMRRYEEARRRRQEANRLRGFLELATRWKEAEAGRLFLDALAERTEDMRQPVGDRTLGEWLAWARERLAAFDPLQIGAEAVFETVAAIDQWTYGEDWRSGRG